VSGTTGDPNESPRYCSKEKQIMKNTIIAALASLMLAGAISAVSGATLNTATGTAVIVGDGTSPIPFTPSPDAMSDGRSNNQN